MNRLLAGLLTSLNPRRGQIGKQRGDHPHRVQQIRQRSQRARLDHVPGCLRVGPPGRHQRLAAIRQHHQQLQHTVPVHPTKHRKRLPFKGVSAAGHPNRDGQRLETGSVSQLRSTESIMIGC
jgi:hypothetical protein